MRRSLALIMLTALAAVGVIAPAPEASAAGGVRIVKVYVNSPGSDTGSKKSLNAEWIRIKNTSSKAKNLTGYTIRDKGSIHVYKFSEYTLGAGKTVTVHTGSGKNTSKVRYWKLDWYVWNNDGDKAVLRTKAGKTLDTCSWKTTDASVSC